MDIFDKSSGDDRYWWRDDLTEMKSDDRNAIPIKFDNVIFAMTAKKCAKNCAQVQRVCFAY